MQETFIGKHGLIHAASGHDVADRADPCHLRPCGPLLWLGEGIVPAAQARVIAFDPDGRFAMERTRNGEEGTIDNSNWSLFDWRPFPEAETWREFHTRVAAAMDRLAGTCSDTTLPILVVHGGTLSNIVVWWLGLPLDALPERTCFAASPGSLSILQRNRHGKPVIERLNDCAHLATLGAGG